MLIGPSRCGKSTLLKSIGECLELAGGTITVVGPPVADTGTGPRGGHLSLASGPRQLGLPVASRRQAEPPSLRPLLPGRLIK